MKKKIQISFFFCFFFVSLTNIFTVYGMFIFPTLNNLKKKTQTKIKLNYVKLYKVNYKNV